MPVDTGSLVLGLVTGIAVPLLSNIIPIKEALGNSLRDALDRFRSGVDEMDVQFMRMENVGVAPNQIIVALLILGNSFLTLYVAPKHIMEINVGEAFFTLNFLLIGVILGLIFLG